MHRLTAALALVLIAGCGITVTNERPSYAELDAAEQAAVDIILAELTAFNAQVKARTSYHIDQLVDREKINVAFKGKIFAANFGDEQVHVSVWENLTPAQQTLVQSWFQAPAPAAARASYENLFYRFLAVSQGVKQYMYNSLGTTWMFEHRSLFNMERDSMRTALAHYQAVGRKAQMWTALTSTCAPVLSQYGPLYAVNFTKEYLAEHVVELAYGDAPTGYMYFICRWISWGKDEAEDLGTELSWLLTLRK